MVWFGWACLFHSKIAAEDVEEVDDDDEDDDVVLLRGFWHTNTICLINGN